VLGERAVLASLFADAGLPGAKLVSRPGTGRFPCIRPLVEADLGRGSPLMGVVQDEEGIRAILAEAEVVLAPHLDAPGAVVLASPGHLVSDAGARARRVRPRSDAGPPRASPPAKTEAHGRQRPRSGKDLRRRNST
jgi:hypothetical protein